MPAPAQRATQKPQEAGEEVPESLRRLMDMDGITAAQVRGIVAQVGYFPKDTPIMNYGTDFIEGMLVADWATVKRMILQAQEETPF